MERGGNLEAHVRTRSDSGDAARWPPPPAAAAAPAARPRAPRAAPAARGPPAAPEPPAARARTGSARARTRRRRRDAPGRWTRRRTTRRSRSRSRCWQIARDYISWGRVDDELRWAPGLCRQPLPGRRPPEHVERSDHARPEAVFAVRQELGELPERPPRRSGGGQAVVEGGGGDRRPTRRSTRARLAARTTTPITSIPTRRDRTAACSTRPSPRACSSCSSSIRPRPRPTRAGSTRRCRPPAR